MFLVILALGVGLVLAGVVLTSRDTSPVIGAHASEISAAQWSGESAAQYAEAVLQTSEDWLGNVGPDGFMFEDFAISGGSASVKIEAADGSTLDASDRELSATVTARFGAMETTIQRHISLRASVPITEAVSLELGGFAAFAGKSIAIADDAYVGPFSLSPDASAPLPVRLGTGFSSAGSLDIKDATLVSVAVANDANATSDLESASKHVRFGSGAKIPFSMPLLPETLPSAFTGLPYAWGWDLTFSWGTTTLSKGGTYHDLTVENGATVILDAAVDNKYSFDDLSIKTGGILQIKGAVYVHVRRSMTVLSRGLISYADAASRVVFFTSDNLTINDAAVGLTPAIAADTGRALASVVAYVSPARCRILALGAKAGGKDNTVWDIQGKAIAVASLHNPRGKVDIHEDSTLIGRATVNELNMRRRATLAYDPALDTRCGYAVLDGPLYSAGALRPAIASEMAKLTADTGVSNAGTTLATAARTALEADTEWNGMVAPEDETGNDGYLKPIAISSSFTSGSKGLSSEGVTKMSGDPPPVIEPVDEPAARCGKKTDTKRVPHAVKKLEKGNG